jgi:hypothetical protein
MLKWDCAARAARIPQCGTRLRSELRPGGSAMFLPTGAVFRSTGEEWQQGYRQNPHARCVRYVARWVRGASTDHVSFAMQKIHGGSTKMPLDWICF